MSHAFIYQSALSDGKVLAPAKSIAEMSRIVINDYVDTALCVLFVLRGGQHGRVRGPIGRRRDGAPAAQRRSKPSPPPPFRPDPMRDKHELAKPKLSERLRLIGKRLGECGHLMVGVPDYETYVAHVARAHPGQAPDDLQGILPRTPGRPLRRRRNEGHALLLSLRRSRRRRLAGAAHNPFALKYFSSVQTAACCSSSISFGSRCMRRISDGFLPSIRAATG